jgi:hypothetical protein
MPNTAAAFLFAAFLSLLSTVCAAMPTPDADYDATDTQLASRAVPREPATSTWANRQYVTHPAHRGSAEVITVRIDQQFKPADHARILRAIQEWNYALNGHIRFDVSAVPFGTPGAASPPRTGRDWVIAHAPGRGPSRGTRGVVLAATQPIPGVGGLMILYADSVGEADLGHIVLHELGHALGLGHDPAALLMSTNYRASIQGCVDEGTAKALASLRSLPLDGLNWCSLPFVSGGR